MASAASPPRYGHGEINQRLSSGTATSQTRMIGPKNSALYLDSSAAPTAAPTASHHAPCPVSKTFARKNRTKADANTSGESGVTIIVSTDTIMVAFSRIAAVARDQRAS